MTDNARTERTLTVSFFNHVQDTIPKQEDLAWDELRPRLMTHDLREQKDGPLFSPACYATERGRAKNNVESIQVLAFDFDEGVRPEDLTPKWARYEYVIHSSYGDTPEKRKWRAVMPLKHPVPAGQWGAMYPKLLGHFTEGADSSVGDLARMFYLPSCPPDAKPFAEHHPGEWVDAFAIVAPPGKGDYSTLDVVKWFDDKGLYRDDLGGGKHAVTCPWAHEHTVQTGPEGTDTVVWEADDGWPTFHCSHAHCEGRGIQSVIDLWGDADRFCTRDYRAQKAPQRKNHSGALVDLVRAAKVDLWHTPEGEPFASVRVNGHTEHLPLRSPAFRGWSQALMFDHTGQTPRKAAVDDALTHLGELARRGDEHTAYLRVGEHEGAVYVDLGNAEWQAVKITPGRYEVVNDPPVRFWRPNGMLPLPLPQRGGDLEDLRRFVNIADEEWPMFAAFITFALLPRGPYPLLVLGGEQGSAKSTTARVAKRLTDPHELDLRKESPDPRNLAISASNTRVLAIDNISRIPEWMSDHLCALATGGGYAYKANYTDKEEVFFKSQMPIILNGIGEFVARDDLLDRSLLLSCPVISDEARQEEADLWPAFEAAHPRILGAIFDAIAWALYYRPQVQLQRRSRMADFHRWGVALEQALGWDEGRFEASYLTNRENARLDALEGAPVGQAVLAFISKQENHVWEGTMSDLLKGLTQADPEAAYRRGWPATPRYLSSALRRIRQSLRTAGVDVSDHRTSAGRMVRVIGAPNVARM